MAQDEAVLLQRFVASGDAGAFSEIVRRYASLVYSACMRILADRETAADATQETFFQFLKKADTITGSIPAWLHRVATGKAVDTIRAESSRRHIKTQYTDLKCRRATKWEDLSPYVDHALEKLDDPTRALLIEYFFQGRSMTDIAADKGISHPTVSRRINAGISRLREQLRKRGIIVAAVTISSLLGENAAQAAPAPVLHELAKMALGGAKLSAPAAAVAGGLLLAAKAKVILVAAVVGISAVGIVTYRHFSRPVKNPDPMVTAENAPPSRGPSVPAPPLVEPEESVGSPELANGAQTRPETPSAESTSDQQVAQTKPPGMEQPHETTHEAQASKIDLSSPEATVRSFTKLMVAGDAESVLACFLPDGADYEDIQEILYADPADPQQRDEYQFRLWFQSLDPDAEMPILEIREKTDAVVSIDWEVTFKRDFTVEGHTFTAGETMKLDAELVHKDGKWLINNL